MKKLLLLLVIAFLAFSCSPQVDHARIKIYFTPDKNGDKPIIELYGKADEYIHLAIFGLTKDSFSEALIEAHNRRGKNGKPVEVKVLMDRSQAANKASDDEKLRNAGIEVRLSKGHGLMHDKFCIIDGKVAYTGSYNHTDNATFHNDENYVVFESEVIAQVYEEQFQKLWKKHQ